ncbi:MAG: YncE family protein [Candidatus Sulfotelmatobacter sp.]
MSLRRVGGLAAMALAAMLEMSCGDVYRPVVLPINPTPPNPANFHAVFGVSTNAPFNPGTAFQIDVSGDSNIGTANMGENPTHAGILPNNARVFVASAGSLNAAGSDLITSFTPAIATSIASGLGTPVVFTYPNFGPPDPASGVPQWTCSYLPDYVATTQTTAVFVANFGVENAASCLPNLASTDSVTALNATTNVIANTSYLPAGSHPVALTETPNALNLYVVNQGNNTISNLSPIDLSMIATISVGATPVWAVSRSDSRRVYVLTEGSGTLVPIDVPTNTILPSLTNLSVGAGANFILYDPHLNRLYVTNPATGTVYVYSTTGGTDLSGTPNDTPVLLNAISMTTGSNPPCPAGCSPVSVAALPDGSRFYVASYASESACTDANVGTSVPCIVPMLTIFDALSMTPKAPASTLLSGPSMSLLASPQFSTTQYAVQPVASCAPAATYAPGTTRFRMFTTASSDSSHVYVSICDAGTIADIRTNTISIGAGANYPDQLIADVVAPSGACTGLCSPPATITSFSISSGVVTFQATNTFTPGTRVAISTLTSSAGIPLNGQTLTVLAAGLSSTQFEGVTNQPDVGSTTDTGNAVPLAPPQAPIFLLTGQ